MHMQRLLRGYASPTMVLTGDAWRALPAPPSRPTPLPPYTLGLKLAPQCASECRLKTCHRQGANHYSAFITAPQVPLITRTRSRWAPGAGPRPRDCGTLRRLLVIRLRRCGMLKLRRCGEAGAAAGAAPGDAPFAAASCACTPRHTVTPGRSWAGLSGGTATTPCMQTRTAADAQGPYGRPPATTTARLNRAGCLAAPVMAAHAC